MKIAMVSLGPAGEVGSLAKALVDQGHDVTVYTRCASMEPRRSREDGEVRVVNLSAGPPRELGEPEVIRYAGAFAERLGEALGRDRPDVVHSHGCLSGLAGLLASRRAGLPVAHTFDRSPQRSEPEKVIIHRAAHLIATGPGVAQDLTRAGVSRRRISLVPPGVDCERLCPDGVAEPRREKFRLVLFGASEHEGPADVLIRALPALADAEVVIARDPGERPWPPAVGERVQRLAARLGVAERVSVRGVCDPDRRPALLRSAHAVLCLGASGRPGVAELEAMACGAPVLATSAADSIDAVVDRVTGLHIDPCAPRSVARIVRELLTNEPLREGMGMAGRDRAIKRYNWARIATETGRAYQRALPP